MLFGQTDAIDNAFNPRNLSEIKVNAENSEVGELEIGCHIAVGLENTKIVLGSFDFDPYQKKNTNTTNSGWLRQKEY